MTPLLGGMMLVLDISLVSYMAVDFLTIALSSAESEREDDHPIARSPKTLLSPVRSTLEQDRCIHLSSSTCLTTRTGEMWFTGCYASYIENYFISVSSRPFRDIWLQLPYCDISPSLTLDNILLIDGWSTRHWNSSINRSRHTDRSSRSMTIPAPPLA